MAAEQFTNNAQTTLNGEITVGATSITVISASGFPSTAQYRIRVDDELMIVTDGAGTTSWTVTRGAEGTTAASHPSGACVTHILTAGAIQNLAIGNQIINGGMNFFQRQAPGTATARNDDTYGPDRWYVLTQTASVNCERVTGDSDSLHACRLTQNQASAQRMGLATIVEGVNSRALRSGGCRFQARIRISNSQAVRIAILEWTGSADVVTSDVVQTWTSTNYAGGLGAGKFFLDSASLLVPTTPASVTPSANIWTDISITGMPSASCNNLILFIWTDGTAAQNVTLDITECDFFEGSNDRDWTPRPIGKELALCQRYYEKSYPVDTAPGTVTTSGMIYGHSSAPAITIGGRYFGGAVHLLVSKRTTPTMTGYSPVTGTSGQFRNYDTPADFGAAFAATGDCLVILRSDGQTEGHTCSAHYTAEAEL